MDNFSRVYGSGPVKRAVVAAATSGDNSLVAAVAGKRIRVLGFFGLAAQTRLRCLRMVDLCCRKRRTVGWKRLPVKL